MVSGLQCPACGHLGVYIAPYGPGASEIDADVAVALPTGTGPVDRSAPDLRGWSPRS
ncbi:MAG: hypothetical protein R2715_22890 [Ilumatobacteraceae bacterium]